MRQIVPVSMLYLEKFDIKPSRLVLSVPACCRKDAYSMTVMENNLENSLVSFIQVLIAPK